jgi:hypothetical protein
LGGLDPRTYEGLNRKFESCRKEELLAGEGAGEFDENTFFLCGKHQCIATEGHERVAAMFSTENLLLNIYRIMCTGVDLTFAVDTSYRYTIQGYGLMPIKIVDLSQRAHAVGYGMVSREDVRAHGFLFAQLKNECERTVEELRVKGYFD